MVPNFRQIPERIITMKRAAERANDEPKPKARRVDGAEATRELVDLTVAGDAAAAAAAAASAAAASASAAAADVKPRKNEVARCAACDDREATHVQGVPLCGTCTAALQACAKKDCGQLTYASDAAVQTLRNEFGCVWKLDSNCHSAFIQPWKSLGMEFTASAYCRGCVRRCRWCGEAVWTQEGEACRVCARELRGELTNGLRGPFPG